MPNLRDVRRQASDSGRAQATWAFDTGTTLVQYRDILKGLEDGDPAVLFLLAPPAWLSSEWAGESMNEVLGLTGRESADRIDELADAFEEAANKAYWREIEKWVRHQVRNDTRCAYCVEHRIENCRHEGM